MKRLIALVLSLVMALSLCVPAWGAEDVEVSTWDGVVPAEMPDTLVVDGDEQIVHVKDAAAFAYLSTLSANWRSLYSDGQGKTYTNYANGKGANYYYSGQWTISLEADIDLANYPIEPVVIMFGEPTGATHFDGNDHVISNINTTTGLFAARPRASFSDFTLLKVKATSGALTNFAEYPVTNVTVENATISGTDYIGGLVGKTYSDIIGCKVVDSSVTATGKEAGGLVGYAEANSKGFTITNNTVKNVSVFANNRAAGLVAQPNANIKVYNNTVDSVTVGAKDETKYKAGAIVSNALAPENVYDNTVKYSVTFDANGGNGVLTQSSVPTGTFTLPTEHPFTREGYTFVGWATEKDATEVLGATYDVTDAVTFYAIWEEVPATPDTPDTPVVPDTPPVEDEEPEGDTPVAPPVEEPVVVPAPEEVDTVVKNDAVMEAVIESITNNSEDNAVTVPAADSTTAKTTIEFNVESDDNGAAAKETFVNATPTDLSQKIAVSPVSESVIESVEEKVEAEATKEVGAKAEIATYLDIDVQLYVNEIHVGNITELPDTIEVVVPAEALPDDINDNIPTGYSRKFYVVRVHDGVTETIPAKMDADGNLSFESHLFSTYAVVYEDVPTYYGWGGYYPTTDNTVVSAPTFDAGIGLYVGMSIMAAVGSAAVIGKKREN